MSRYEPRSKEADFIDFLRQLVKAKYLQDAPLGITKYVIDNGRDSLSEKQEFIFQKEVMEKFVHERCKKCNEEIPWNHMFFAIEEGYCTECDPELHPVR